MPILTPSQAAEIARGVYDLRSQSVADALKTGIGTDGLFAIEDGSTFSGKSGALMFKKLSTFGYIARGIGPFAGEVLVATRGTAMLADWVTDANIGMQLGPSSLIVHAGFNDTWKSYASELRSFFQHHNPTRVHCVGHSLGGALATLNADYCSVHRIAQVELYTFGCPRVGDGFFARSLTNRLGAGSIHRVSHPADPVPMIPLFPFWHLPFGQHGLGIAATSNALISFGAHGMEPIYIPGVRDHSWATLGHGGVGADADQRVRSWLEQAADGQGAFAMGSATLLSMIGRALRWLLARAGQAVMGGIGVAVTASATLLDQLAWLLGRAAQLSKEVVGYVKGLIGAIFGFLGRKIAGTADVTTAFLRWMLELLFTSLRAVAVRALALLA